MPPMLFLSIGGFVYPRSSTPEAQAAGGFLIGFDWVCFLLVRCSRFIVYSPLFIRLYVHLGIQQNWVCFDQVSNMYFSL